MRGLMITLASAAMVASIGGTAQAAVLVAPSTVSGGSISRTGPVDYSTQLGTLSLFDTNLGTLTGVTLDVGYAINSTITVSAATAASGTVFTESAVNFDSTNSAIASILNRVVNNKPAAFIGASQLGETAFDLYTARTSYSLSAGASQSFSGVASAASTYQLAASDFSAFTAGTRTRFDIFGTSLTGLNIASTGGNASASQNTAATQRISVTYAYIPTAIVTPAVPEPATWAMMLVGFGMVAGAARYRRRSTGMTYA